MKIDLAKVFTISGEQGLFTFVAQASKGAILESMITKKRMMAGPSAKMSALTDISVYTQTDEVKLQQVFESINKVLNGDVAPSGKRDPKDYITLFEKALPDYDDTRFYPSHMRKICEWYNCLREYASLDFLTDQEREQQENS